MGLISYVKTVWKATKAGGTPITPESLNNIENGIEAAITQINKNSNSISTINEDIVKKINWNNSEPKNYNSFHRGLTCATEGYENAPEDYCYVLTLMQNDTGYGDAVQIAFSIVSMRIYRRRKHPSKGWESWLAIDFYRKTEHYTNSTYLDSVVEVVKCGRIVEVAYNGAAKKIDANSHTLLFTLADEYKPPRSLWIPVRANVDVWILINTLGEVSYYARAASTSLNNFQFNTTYII